MFNSLPTGVVTDNSQLGERATHKKTLKQVFNWGCPSSLVANEDIQWKVLEKISFLATAKILSGRNLLDKAKATMANLCKALSFLHNLLGSDGSLPSSKTLEDILTSL